MAPLRKKGDDQLFESDVTGSQHLRRALQAEYSEQPGLKARRQAKPLKSSQIIAQARGNQTVSLLDAQKSGQTARAREKARIGWNRDIEKRSKALVRRNGTVGQTGRATSAPNHLLKNSAKSYDMWEIDAAPKEVSLDLELVPQIQPVKAPSNLRKHDILSNIPEHLQPAAIAKPHPGHSYNPSQDAHQSLLGEALTQAQAEELKSAKRRELKETFDKSRATRKGKESWQLAEEDVDQNIGQVDEDEESNQVEQPAIKRISKRKTSKEKAKRRNNLWLEREAFRARKILKAQKQDISSLPRILKAINAQPAITAASTLAQQMALAQRVHIQGLSGLRIGSRRRVPATKSTFQLEEELADSLRLLKPEGNLWRDWIGSKERRGQVEVSGGLEEVVRQRKRKGRSTKIGERYDFRRFE